MIRKKQFLIYFLFFFSAYCALTIGESWDEYYYTALGKRNLIYLFTLGRIEPYFGGSFYYSTLYWDLQYFFSQLLSYKYQTEVNHLINLLFSFSAIFAISKIGRQLFNKKIGEIFFLLLFFYPEFFGHMGQNPKDTILAFCHLWILSLVLSYLKNQHLEEKSRKYIYCISILIATGTGIQLYFPASLLIIIFFIIIEILFIKKIINKKFNKIKFYGDLIKIFFLSFLIYVFFAPDTHGNILYKPYLFFLKSLEAQRGGEYTLINGLIFLSKNPPKLYFYQYFFYKSPEFIIFLYIIFFTFFLKINKFYKKIISNYFYKLVIIITLMLYPFITMLIIPFGVYDGIRLFLWIVPYFMIIPGVTIYFLIKNINSNFFYRILAFISLILFFIYLVKFLLYTPYQYSYFNIFAGNNVEEKFEKDYWGVSLKELIKKNKNFFLINDLKLSTCGVSNDIVTKYIKLYSSKSIELVDPSKAEYIIMTNRVVNNKATCFQFYKGKNISEVKRDNKLLSSIRHINYE
jgi:hypothetical protein